jgi:hypothetical protein
MSVHELYPLAQTPTILSGTSVEGRLQLLPPESLPEPSFLQEINVKVMTAKKEKINFFMFWCFGVNKFELNLNCSLCKGKYRRNELLKANDELNLVSMKTSGIRK